MSLRIALLRGINVGGKNVLPMKTLAEDLRDLGLDAVKTYIQSGNVVFRDGRDDRSAAALGEAIGETIETRHGFRPQVLVLTASEWTAIAKANPYPEATDDPKTLHVFVCATPPPAPDLERLDALRAPDERIRLDGRVLYLHAPSGIGRSKLAAKAETALGVPVTARNWRTVGKLIAMIDAIDGA
ncbi:MAG: DUF1697 domain-containing protein [Acidobacteriota bacterium]